MIIRSFSKEDDQGDNSTASENGGEAVYQFEGFKIEFSDKVMLTPLAAAAKK